MPCMASETIYRANNIEGLADNMGALGLDDEDGLIVEEEDAKPPAIPHQFPAAAARPPNPREAAAAMFHTPSRHAAASHQPS